MLRLDIKKYVDDQFDNLNQFAKASGLNYQAAQKIYNGETSRITFDNLESICKVLNVTPNDIFIFDNAINNTSQESSKKQIYTMPVLKPIRIDPEKLRPEPKYSDDFLYKLIVISLCFGQFIASFHLSAILFICLLIFFLNILLIYCIAIFILIL